MEQLHAMPTATLDRLLRQLADDRVRGGTEESGLTAAMDEAMKHFHGDGLIECDANGEAFRISS